MKNYHSMSSNIIFIKLCTNYCELHGLIILNVRLQELASDTVRWMSRVAFVRKASDQVRISKKKNQTFRSKGNEQLNLWLQQTVLRAWLHARRRMSSKCRLGASRKKSSRNRRCRWKETKRQLGEEWCRLGWTGSGWGPVAGSCDSSKGEDILDCLRTY